jgi:hypothetical protein
LQHSSGWFEFRIIRRYGDTSFPIERVGIKYSQIKSNEVNPYKMYAISFYRTTRNHLGMTCFWSIQFLRVESSVSSSLLLLNCQCAIVVLSPLVDIPSHGQTGIKWKPTCFSNPLRFSFDRWGKCVGSAQSNSKRSCCWGGKMLVNDQPDKNSESTQWT